MLISCPGSKSDLTITESMIDAMGVPQIDYGSVGYYFSSWGPCCHLTFTSITGCAHIGIRGAEQLETSPEQNREWN